MNQLHRVVVLTVAVCAGAASTSAQTFTPGVPVPGSHGYIEYYPGNLPLIFSAPHGGDLTPASIPARTQAACGEEDFSTTRDLNTAELALAIQAAFLARTGKYPHVVINRLHRSRLDANRPVDGAACGNADATQAWHEFHQFINVAKAAVMAEYGRGFYTDLHGHGHAILRLELGYNITATTLRRSDADIDGDAAVEASSSINTFSQESPRTFSALLRGQTALGTLFATGGYPAVPGAQDPAPLENQAFFSGGYNTREHGCMNGGTICGVQIEANNAGVRNSATNRALFAMKLVEVYDEYLSSNFEIHLPPPPPPPTPGTAVIVDNLNTANDPAWARFEASANWSSTAMNNGAWNPPSFRLASASSSATNDGAEFFFMIARPGTYRIDSWWPALSTRSPGASYRVFEIENGLQFADLLLDQRINGSQWNELGTFQFSLVNWGKVLMSRSLSSTPGSLAADAVRATLIEAPNRAPYARLAAPISGSEGSPIAFDGSGSFDLDHDAITHAWDFGDGAAAGTTTAAHAFANNGAFDVTLTVTDAHAAPGAMVRTIAIANVAPAIGEFAGATLLAGETYDAAGAFADPGADVWTATADYGDGGGATALTIDDKQFTLSHLYSAAGVYQVIVDVFDGDDHGTRTAEVVVLSPAQGLEQLTATVNGLVATGALSSGNGRSLIAKLEAGQLGAFINEVEAMIRSGRLPESSVSLIELAERIIRSLAA